MLKSIREIGKLASVAILGFVLGQQYSSEIHPNGESLVAERITASTLYQSNNELGRSDDYTIDNSNGKVATNDFKNEITQTTTDAAIDKKERVVSEFVVDSQGVMETQTQSELYLDEFEFTQDNEDLDSYDLNLIEPVFGMDAQERKQYIKTLSENQDDESIQAINAMVFENDMSLRAAAVDELIEIMSYDTGHYDMIKQFLEENTSYMSDEQAEKLEVVADDIDERRTTFAAAM